MNECSREDLAWVAGLIEGEGCISRNNHKAPAVPGVRGAFRGDSSTLQVVMTDEDVVRRRDPIDSRS